MDSNDWEQKTDDGGKRTRQLAAELRQSHATISRLTAELEERVNARTLELEEQRRVAEARSREAALLRRVAKTLNHAVDWQDALEQTLAEISAVFGCRAGWIYRVNNDGGVRQAAAWNLPPALNRDIRRRTTLCECQRRLLAGELHHSVNILHCQRLAEARGDTGGLADTHASIPIFHGERWLGVMNLARAAGEAAHSEEDLRLLLAVGQQLAVALERTRLFEAERQRTEALTRANDLIAALSHVAARLGRTPDPDQVTQVLGAELRRLGLTCCLLSAEPGKPNLVLHSHSIESGALVVIEKLIRTRLTGLPVFPNVFFIPTP